jgi:hypothetical protein
LKAEGSGGGEIRACAVGHDCVSPAPPQNKKPSNPARSENEGIQEIPARTASQAGLILLFAEKLAPQQRETVTRATKPVS